MKNLPLNERDYIKGMVSKSSSFVNEEDMEKVQGALVAQAGFGGIGGFVLELLARWGIRRFRLLDMDRYELSNMNRQVFATSKTLGRDKAEVAGERIKEINPYAEIERVQCEKLTRDNAEEFVKGATVVINGIDFPSGQIPLHYHAKRHKVPVINPHCMDVKGATLEVFDYRREDQQSIDAPTKSEAVNNMLRKQFKLFSFNEETLGEESLAKADERFKGKRGATLNSVTNLAACLAASETIKLLTGEGKQVLYPNQIYVNPYDLEFRIRSVYSPERAVNYVKERVLGR